MAPRVPIAEIIGQISKAMSKGPVETESARTAEELAARVPEITQHLPGVPFAGGEKLKPYVRATRSPAVQALEDRVQSAKSAVGAIFTAEPNLTKEYQNLFLDARYKVATAGERAEQIIHQRVTSKLEGDVPGKARLMSDYLTLADEFSDLHAKFTKDPTAPVYGRGGSTIDEIETALHSVYGEMVKHPDAVQASQGFRAVSDELFQDMVRYGLITPNRYRKDWTPRQQLMEMARGLSEAYGDQSVGGEVLSQMQARTMTGGVTETNMVKVLRDVLKDYHEKVAGDELVVRVLSDPSLNRTESFRVGDRLPKGWVTYRPRPGLPGWKIPDADAQVAAGVADVLGADPRVLTPGGFVIPEDMANRLTHFYPERPSAGSETAYRAGRFVARAFTVYNPANTALNLGSDFGVALMGMPGERANPLGFLRFYPVAMRESFRGAFGKESPVFERAVQEGLGSATYVKSVAGSEVPTKLASAMGETPEGGLLTHAKNLARRSRLAVEMSPRIAAGMAAEASTGLSSEFGRVGRAITLPYGAGAPAVTRSNLTKWIAPFWQFMGLASERMGRLLVTPGSRARTWSMVLGVPVGAFMWNRQNEDFRQVEFSLHKRDRYAMHLIAMGEGGKPALDRNGKPIVLRFRYFVPEEVAQQYGISNLPARIEDLLSGSIGLGDAAGEMVGSAVEQAGQQFVPGQIVSQIASGKDISGMERPRLELARRSIPIVRQVEEGVRGVQNVGPVEGVKRLGEEMSGVRFATPVRKGRSDADIADLQIKLRDARSQMKSMYRRGDRARGNEYKAKVYKIANRIRAINKSRRKARRKK